MQKIKYIISVLFIFIFGSCEKRSFERKMLVTNISVELKLNYAKAYATIVDLGEANSVEFGHCWATHSIPTIDDNSNIINNITTTGQFETQLNLPNDSLVYYVRAYISSGYSVTYSDEVSFKNIYTHKPVINNGSCVNASETDVYIYGNLSNLGFDFSNFAHYGHCWSETNSQPTVYDEKTTFDSTSTVLNFYSFIQGLTPQTTYYIRAYAENNLGIVYDEVMQFTTKNPKTIESIFCLTDTFSMGCDTCDFADAKPEHKVMLAPFWIAKFETTTEQYCSFLNQASDIQAIENFIYLNPLTNIIKIGEKYFPTQNHGKQAMGGVPWDGAVAFCEWVGGKLPTEAQWEYAARGGKYSQNNTFAGSLVADLVAWYSISSFQNVGSKMPNELGLFDMSGNVSEWCADYYSATYYQSSPLCEPTGPISGTERVYRGGSIQSTANQLYMLRTVYRNSTENPIYTGFRVVKK